MIALQRHAWLALACSLLVIFCACDRKQKYTTLAQLEEKEWAAPTGTVSDILVKAKMPKAKFKYFNSIMDAAMAVKTGKADAVAYDEPILRNLVAKSGGFRILPERISFDEYGFAVQLGNDELRQAIEAIVQEAKDSKQYEAMILRWLPSVGNPAPMPVIVSTGTKGVLRLGTAAANEPFSFMDASRQVVGLDIEIASLVAKRLDKKLEILDMEFGAMIPALAAVKVDMIAACLTITQERAKKVLFTKPYYIGGMSALVKD